MSRVVATCALCLVLSLVALFGKIPEWWKSDIVNPSAPSRGLMSMPSMVQDDPSIDFAGVWHIAYTQWQSNENGEWEHKHMMTRPGWQKTTKCFGNSSMTCEECSGASDCWTGSADGSRLVQMTGAVQDAVRYVSAIHVRCSSPILHVAYEVEDLMYGQLRILWDGVEVEQHASNGTSGLPSKLLDTAGTYQQEYSIGARAGSVDISTERLGAHVIEIEFIPFSGESRVKLSHLQIAMPKEYADCADYKTCLDPISASTKFRNDNSQQLKCLQAATPLSEGEDCARWRACLTEDLQEQLRTMLVAAGVGGYTLNASGLALNVSNASFLPVSGQEEGPDCINPLVQDAESWTCDCFEEMQSVCRALGSDDELCMRAQLCEHPRTCHSWKEQACDEPEIQAMQALVGAYAPSVRRALMSRREGDGDKDEVFDRALGDKACL